jgi:maltodextrin utilization protein YvdJ
LEAVSETLKLSESEAEEWKAKSTSLSASLTNISEELTSSHELSIKLKQELTTANKVAVIFFAIIVIRFLFTIVGFILMSKGVQVPLWLALIM